MILAHPEMMRERVRGGKGKVRRAMTENSGVSSSVPRA
jgi:hypothetical protein